MSILTAHACLFRQLAGIPVHKCVIIHEGHALPHECSSLQHRKLRVPAAILWRAHRKVMQPATSAFRPDRCTRLLTHTQKRSKTCQQLVCRTCDYDWLVGILLFYLLKEPVHQRTCSMQDPAEHNTRAFLEENRTLSEILHIAWRVVMRGLSQHIVGVRKSKQL